MNDWNNNIIEEFRTNEGRVGGPFDGHPLLLLHHFGAKTGIERVNPLACQPLDDESWAIFASKGGAATNPDWFHNLVTKPHARIEIGTEVFDVTARVAHGKEREQIWSRQKELMPGFAVYEKKAPREIPVIVLEKAP